MRTEVTARVRVQEHRGMMYRLVQGWDELVCVVYDDPPSPHGLLLIVGLRCKVYILSAVPILLYHY